MRISNIRQLNCSSIILFVRTRGQGFNSRIVRRLLTWSSSSLPRHLITRFPLTDSSPLAFHRSSSYPLLINCARNYMASDMDQSNYVLYYWFDELVDMKSKMSRWFGSSDAQNKEIREKFGELVHKARNGELKLWEENPRSALAVVILLDQFCRNLFKGTADAFSHDHVARSIVRQFLPGGPFSHKDLTIEQRFMLYLPIEHSENLDDQDTSVQLYEELVKDSGTEEEKGIAVNGLKYAKDHRDVIKMFGRYPRRNKALGRVSTPEEEQYLKDNPHGF